MTASIVDVYYIVGRVAEWNNIIYNQFLSVEDIGEINSTKTDYQRNRRHAARVCLRLIIHTIFGRFANDHPVGRYSSGKPYMKGNPPELYFNQSYSKEWFIVAVSESEIGVDIEAKALSPDWNRRVNFVADRQLIVPSKEPLEEWSLIEALIKLAGGSISSSFAKIHPLVTSTPPWRYTTNFQSNETMWARLIQAPPGCKASIASKKIFTPSIVQLEESICRLAY